MQYERKGPDYSRVVSVLVWADNNASAAYADATFKKQCLGVFADVESAQRFCESAGHHLDPDMDGMYLDWELAPGEEESY